MLNGQLTADVGKMLSEIQRGLEIKAVKSDHGLRLF